MAADGALDLSKPVGEGVVMSSPASSLSPEPDPDPVPEVERSESISSDGHDTGSSTSTTVKAISGPLPSSHLPAMTSATTTPSGDTNTSDSVPNTMARPFKMYPFEPVPGVYSQLAAAANANPSLPSAAGYLNPFAAVAGSSMPFGLFDSAISLSSPIGQYLAQRKRRAEAAQSNSTDSLNTPNLDSAYNPSLKTESDTSSLGNVSDDPSSEPPSPKVAKTEEVRDASYWERRRKNNEAAKRSRDSRRAKEEEIALRAAFLEQENLKLRAQVAILKNETAKLHYMLYNRV